MPSSTTIWEAAQSGTDPQARDDLLMEHINLVHHVARQVARSSGIDIDFDELVSAGTIGLMNAIDNFDPSRGYAFSTFAAPRIRGSVLDDLRRRDTAPRSVRKKQRDMARARRELQAQLKREPSDEELAGHLEIELPKLWRWQRDTEQAGTVSIDRKADTQKGEGAPIEQILVGEEGTDIEDQITRQEEIEILRREILGLKEQERIVLSLYYFEELKLHEIASILGVTESRISQIRSKAVEQLRSTLAHLREA